LAVPADALRRRVAAVGLRRARLADHGASAGAAHARLLLAQAGAAVAVVLAMVARLETRRGRPEPGGGGLTRTAGSGRSADAWPEEARAVRPAVGVVHAIRGHMDGRVRRAARGRHQLAGRDLPAIAVGRLAGVLARAGRRDLRRPRAGVVVAVRDARRDQ